MGQATISAGSSPLCQRANGDRTAAEPLSRRARAGAQRVLRPDHASTVPYCNTLATLTGGA